VMYDYSELIGRTILRLCIACIVIGYVVIRLVEWAVVKLFF
jgi:hypothetical protein